MIILYSDTHCNRCRGVEAFLKTKGLEFEKRLLSEISQDEHDKVVHLARESGSLALPVILKNGIVVQLGDL